MAVPSSGPISFSQIRSIAARSGSISMSQFGQFTRSGNVVSTANINVGSFAALNPTFVSGLQFRTFPQGYHNEDPTFFDRNTESVTGLITDFTNLTTATNSTYLVNGIPTYFSVEWYGYFYAPTTGTYTFTLGSDDGSYLWMGSSALSGYATSNCVVNNGGTHAVVYVSGTISLTANTYTPIRIQFGEAAGGKDCQCSFSGPGISTTNNFSGYAFFPIGGNASFPANAARLIKNVTATNTDGTYFINVNGTSALTYCLMNSAWNGGGWMMMMKATRGTTFNYSSGYWTAINTLNTGSTDLTDADAKFNVMNYAQVKDLLALWPDTGYSGGSIPSPPIFTWTWLANNYSYGSRVTVLSGLNTSRDVTNDTSATIGTTGQYVYGEYIQVALSARTAIDSYTIGSGTGSAGNVRKATRYALLGSHDGNIWTSIDQPTTPVTYSGSTCTRAVSASYSYYRFVIQSLQDLQFWYLVIHYFGLSNGGTALFNSGNAISGANGDTITNGSLVGTVSVSWFGNTNFNTGFSGNLGNLLTNTSVADSPVAFWGTSSQAHMNFLTAWYPSGNVSSTSTVSKHVTGFGYTGWNQNIWSTQSGIAAHIMGGGTHHPNKGAIYARWGFLFNNEVDWLSSDVSGGIGLSFNSYSAGDYISCCQHTTGLNRTMRVQLFGR
jgi:hypothetical protein